MVEKTICIYFRLLWFWVSITRLHAKFDYGSQRSYKKIVDGSRKNERVCNQVVTHGQINGRTDMLKHSEFYFIDLATEP